MRVYRPISTPETINQEILSNDIEALGNVLVVRDPQGWRIDIFDATTDAAIQTVIDAHDGTQQTEEQIRAELNTLTRSDVVTYFRQQLIEANGNASAIATIYTQARAYEQQNAALTSTMLSLRTIEETADTITLNLTTNAGKAAYLRLFLIAIGLWS